MYHPPGPGWDIKYTKSLYYSGCKSPPAAAALDRDERLGVSTSTGGCKAALSIVAGLPGPPGAVWGSASSARPPAGRLTKKAPAHAHEVTLAGDSSREGERGRERESRFEARERERATY